jgi:hypothetical protein
MMTRTQPLSCFVRPAASELFDGLGVELGRGREVEEAVPLSAALAVNFFE